MVCSMRTRDFTAPCGGSLICSCRCSLDLVTTKMVTRSANTKAIAVSASVYSRGPGE